jgi:hypothetical protein
MLQFACACLPLPQPPGGAAAVQLGEPPSAEGDHQRCFQSMLVCTHGLDIQRWPLHEYGRHVVRAYHHLLPPEAAAAVNTQSSLIPPPQQPSPQASRKGRPGSSGASGSGRTSSGGDSGSGAATTLNIVFQKRQGDTRQILNSEELLERCNSWQHRTAAGRRLQARCWEVSGEWGE